MKESDNHNDILTRGPLDVCDIGEKNESDGELSCWSKLH